MSLNISFVLPCFKRAAWLRMSLPLNHLYRRPDVEVILVLDEPSEEQKILDIVKANTDIKFKVLVNDWTHPWRPPCMAINVGVRHAIAPHICILSPETIVSIPEPGYLQTLLQQDWRPVYGGILWTVPDGDPLDTPNLVLGKMQNAEAYWAPSQLGYGFIMCQRHAFEGIAGMDESRIYYGGDDNDLRYRLARSGLRTIIDPCIKLFHPLHKAEANREQPRDAYYPGVVLQPQKETWGMAYNRILFSWEQ